MVRLARLSMRRPRASWWPTTPPGVRPTARRPIPRSPREARPHDHRIRLRSHRHRHRRRHRCRNGRRARPGGRAPPGRGSHPRPGRPPISYPELGRAVRDIAGGLAALGIERGDHVAILAGTRPEWTLADLGALCAGATVVPIYQTNSPEECEYILAHAGRPRDLLRGRRAGRQDRAGPRALPRARARHRARRNGAAVP